MTDLTLKVIGINEGKKTKCLPSKEYFNYLRCERTDIAAKLIQQCSEKFTVFLGIHNIKCHEKRE